MEVQFYCCNYCKLNLMSANESFSMTQCGHLFCSKCITDVSDKKKCFRCETKNVTWMPLNVPLQPQIAPFFSTCEAALNQLQKVISFKTTQTMIAMEHLSNTARKYTIMKKEYWILVQKVDHLKKKIKHLEQELQLKEKECKKFRQQSNVVSPLFSIKKNSIIRGSMSNVNSPTDALRNRLSNVQFSPINRNINHNDSVFRVPSVNYVPRSRGRDSCGSTGSQIQTPFSDYSSNHSGSN